MARQADRIIADRYVLGALLGRGGMGVVWRAQDAVLGREVALKEVVFPATMPEQERRPARARVLREARAAARLNHPAAVTLYDVVQDHLLLGLVVAFAGYGLLSGRTWARAAAIALAVLSAISNFLFIPYYPFWAILIITLDIFVIWAIAAHGGDLREPV